MGNQCRFFKMGDGLLQFAPTIASELHSKATHIQCVTIIKTYIMNWHRILHKKLNIKCNYELTVLNYSMTIANMVSFSLTHCSGHGNTMDTN